MRPSDLLTRHEQAWQAATRHQFLDAARDGTLSPQVFGTWLVQDFLFVADELACQAELLTRAPRAAKNLLVRGLTALVAELGWFESHAQRRNLSLDATRSPACVAYREFLQSLEQRPYPVAITAIWAIERAYFDAWKSAYPCQSQYQEYVEHWVNADFEHFVEELEQTAEIALSSANLDREAEAAFIRVAQLERDFWNMAWSGGVS
jgi:formylaminopyrimidine deformylase / aminopyrimidine aminohydrolase